MLSRNKRINRNGSNRSERQPLIDPASNMGIIEIIGSKITVRNTLTLCCFTAITVNFFVQESKDDWQRYPFQLTQWNLWLTLTKQLLRYQAVRKVLRRLLCREGVDRGEAGTVFNYFDNLVLKSGSTVMVMYFAMILPNSIPNNTLQWVNTALVHGLIPFSNAVDFYYYGREYKAMIDLSTCRHQPDENKTLFDWRAIITNLLLIIIYAGMTALYEHDISHKDDLYSGLIGWNKDQLDTVELFGATTILIALLDTVVLPVTENYVVPGMKYGSQCACTIFCCKKLENDNRSPIRAIGTGSDLSNIINQDDSSDNTSNVSSQLEIT